MFAFSLPLEVQISDIIPWSIIAQIMKKFPAFSEPDISVLCSQEPATGPLLSHVNPVDTLVYFH